MIKLNQLQLGIKKVAMGNHLPQNPQNLPRKGQWLNAASACVYHQKKYTHASGPNFKLQSQISTFCVRIHKSDFKVFTDIHLPLVGLSSRRVIILCIAKQCLDS